MHIILDIECYTNYFLARFIREDSATMSYQIFNGEQHGFDLSHIIAWCNEHTLVTFNGSKYDIPILSLASHGATTEQLKAASDAIIQTRLMPWQFERKYGINLIQHDHIDIIELLPLIASLKLYGARNGTNKLQELPIDPAAIITPEQAKVLFEYCGNDCIVTWELLVTMWPQIELRIAMSQQYGVDLRSKSDAQIAETVIKSEYLKMTGMALKKPENPPKTIRYRAPDWVHFETDELYQLSQLIISTTLEISEKTGKPLAPPSLKNKRVKVADKSYTIGLGGLHSVDKGGSHYAMGGWQIIDIDVASFYPMIILNNEYEPAHMGANFTRIYRDIVETRLDAKATGKKVAADALKIVINGTYGKLGSHWSVLYSPQLMLSVTFTGQLALLMLIEDFAAAGIRVLSANTDGITVMVKDPGYKQVVCEWEQQTGFAMEETHYQSIHYRDVNNYVAIKPDGSVKTKGIFKPADISKNPANQVCFDAVLHYLTDRTPPIEHVRAETDICKFLELRTVKGGASKNGEHIGKAVRWYKSWIDGTPIRYELNDNSVANSMGGVPMMDLEAELPYDLDYEWYADNALEILRTIGVRL